MIIFALLYQINARILSKQPDLEDYDLASSRLAGTQGFRLGFCRERQKCNKDGPGPDANAVRVLQRF